MSTSASPIRTLIVAAAAFAAGCDVAAQEALDARISSP